MLFPTLVFTGAWQDAVGRLVACRVAYTGSLTALVHSTSKLACNQTIRRLFVELSVVPPTAHAHTSGSARAACVWGHLLDKPRISAISSSSDLPCVWTTSAASTGALAVAASCAKLSPAAGTKGAAAATAAGTSADTETQPALLLVLPPTPGALMLTGANELNSEIEQSRRHRAGEIYDPRVHVRA